MHPGSRQPKSYQLEVPANITAALACHNPGAAPDIWEFMRIGCCSRMRELFVSCGTLAPAQVVISPSSCRMVQSVSIHKHMSLTSGDSQVELLPSFNPIKDVRYSLKSRSITLTICLVPCNYTVLLDTCKPVPQACSSFVPATVFRSTTVSQNYKQWQWTIDLTTQPQQPSSGQQTLICRQHHHLPE